jgi:hypothetical protein
MLLLCTFAWMACNFAIMATCFNGLCMSPLMLQLWASWSVLNGMNSKIVTPSLCYVKLCSRFWHCCQVFHFFIPIFSTKNFFHKSLLQASFTLHHKVTILTIVPLCTYIWFHSMIVLCATLVFFIYFVIFR